MILESRIDSIEMKRSSVNSNRSFFSADPTIDLDRQHLLRIKEFLSSTKAHVFRMKGTSSSSCDEIENDGLTGASFESWDSNNPFIEELSPSIQVLELSGISTFMICVVADEENAADIPTIF